MLYLRQLVVCSSFLLLVACGGQGSAPTPAPTAIRIVGEGGFNQDQPMELQAQVEGSPDRRVVWRLEGFSDSLASRYLRFEYLPGGGVKVHADPSVNDLEEGFFAAVRVASEGHPEVSAVHHFTVLPRAEIMGFGGGGSSPRRDGHWSVGMRLDFWPAHSDVELEVRREDGVLLRHNASSGGTLRLSRMWYQDPDVVGAHTYTATYRVRGGQTTQKSWTFDPAAAP